MTHINGSIYDVKGRKKRRSISLHYTESWPITLTTPCPWGVPINSHIWVAKSGVPTHHSVPVVRFGLSSTGTLWFVGCRIDPCRVPFIRIAYMCHLFFGLLIEFSSNHYSPFHLETSTGRRRVFMGHTSRIIWIDERFNLKRFSKKPESRWRIKPFYNLRA